jgi:adenosylcobinamide-phosphate synthase
MSFFSILLALVLEQARPLGRDNPAHVGLRHWSEWARRALDAGQRAHGWLAWSLAVVAPALGAALLYGLLHALHPLLGFVWLVLVLYLTLGFRQFSHHFTAIRVALESGDEQGARLAFARWKNARVDESPRAVFLRQVIEFSVLSAHRHVFGVLVCFVVCAALGLGPAGAVLYRLAEHVGRRWGEGLLTESDQASQRAAARAWHVIDYLPVRVTALAFAVVGNFEEAMAHWRHEQRTRDNDALLVSATAGALNVRWSEIDPLMGPGLPRPLGLADHRAPQLSHLASVVGLVWRSVLLWLLLLALGVLARWV